MSEIDRLAHICSGWCNHPDVPTVIVTLAYLDKLRAAGVTLAPTPPDATLREAAQAVVKGWETNGWAADLDGDVAALRAALEADHE